MIATRNKILGEVLGDIKQTKSGLWIADKVKEIPRRCVVLSVGVNLQDQINIGDIVHFKRSWNKIFYRDNKKIVAISKDEIIAIER